MSVREGKDKAEDRTVIDSLLIVQGNVEEHVTETRHVDHDLAADGQPNHTAPINPTSMSPDPLPAQATAQPGPLQPIRIAMIPAVVAVVTSGLNQRTIELTVQALPPKLLSLPRSSLWRLTVAVAEE